MSTSLAVHLSQTADTIIKILERCFTSIKIKLAFIKLNIVEQLERNE